MRAKSGKQNGFTPSSASTLAHVFGPKKPPIQTFQLQIIQVPPPEELSNWAGALTNSDPAPPQRLHTRRVDAKRGDTQPLKKKKKRPSPPKLSRDVPPSRTTGAPLPSQASHRPPLRDFLLGAPLGPNPRRQARRPACRPRQAAGEVLLWSLPAAIFRPPSPPRRGGRSRRRRLRRGAPVSAAAPRAQHAGPKPPRGL